MKWSAAAAFTLWNTFPDHQTEMAARLGPEGKVLHASPRLSLDNGAMVARAGVFRLERGERAGADASADASMPFPGLIRRR